MGGLNKRVLIIFSILLGLFVAQSPVLALEVSWPISPGGTVLTDASGITEFIKYFYEWSFTIGVVATFFTLVWGGFLYLTSAGNPSRMQEATSIMTSSVLGLILLLSSVLILNTINPDLTTLKSPELENVDLGFGALAPGVSDPITSCKDAIIFEEKNCGGSCGTSCSWGASSLAQLTVDTCYNVADGGHFMPKSVDKYKDMDCSTGELKYDGGLCSIQLFDGVGCQPGQHVLSFIVPIMDLPDLMGLDSAGDDPDQIDLNWDEVQSFKFSKRGTKVY